MRWCISAIPVLAASHRLFEDIPRQAHHIQWQVNGSLFSIAFSSSCSGNLCCGFHLFGLFTVVTHICLWCPFSCIRGHEEHQDVLKDMGRFPGFVNVYTNRTSRVSSLDVCFQCTGFPIKGPLLQEQLPSLQHIPLDPNFISLPYSYMGISKTLMDICFLLCLDGSWLGSLQFSLIGTRPQMCRYVDLFQGSQEYKLIEGLTTALLEFSHIVAGWVARNRGQHLD